MRTGRATTALVTVACLWGCSNSHAGGTGARTGSGGATGSGGGAVVDLSVFYVAQDGNDAWSGHLPAPAASDGPFRTVGRAVQALNDNGDAANAAGASIQIRAGTYFLDAPLVITDHASGSPAHPVILESYAGERAVISGGVPLTGWAPKSGASDPNLLESKVSVPTTALTGMFQMLRVARSGSDEGVWASQARYPKKADDISNPSSQNTSFWLYAAGPAVGGPWGASDTYLSLPLQAADYAALSSWDLSNAQVTIFPLTYDVRTLPFWQLSGGAAAPALSIFGGPYGATSGPAGMRFAVSNIPEAITDPGEWSIDRAAGTVLYRNPAGEDVTHESLVLGRLGSLLAIQGTAGSPAHDIVVRGLAFADTACSAKDYYPTFTEDFAVDVSFAAGVTVQNNLFELLGGNALSVRSGSAQVTVEGNVFSHVAGGAVLLLSSTETSAPDASHAPKQVSILGNYIADAGHSLKTGAILFYSATDSTVEGNLVYLAGSPGVQLLGVPGSVSTNNRVLFNDVHTANYGIADGGGIYLATNDGSTPGSNQVMNNRVLDTTGALSQGGQLVSPTGGVGIYLDNGESGDLVQGNIVANASSGALLLHLARDNMVVGNLFVDGGDREITISSAGSSATFPPVSGNVMFSNVVGVTAANFGSANVLFRVLLDPGASFPSAFGSGGNWFTVPDPSSVQVGTPGAPVVFFIDDSGATKEQSFAAWVALAEDTNSTLGGPTGELLADAAGHVYGLAAGSLSGKQLGPLPGVAIGLQHYADTHLSGTPKHACLSALLTTAMYSIPSPAMPDPNAVFACLRAP